MNHNELLKGYPKAVAEFAQFLLKSRRLPWKWGESRADKMKRAIRMADALLWEQVITKADRASKYLVNTN